MKGLARRWRDETSRVREKKGRWVGEERKNEGLTKKIETEGHLGKGQDLLRVGVGRL